MIRNKTIKFDMNKEEEKELWTFLSHLEHGEFSMLTKEFWRIRMKERKSQELRIGMLNESWYGHLENIQKMIDEEQKKNNGDR